uniref:Uncharacterized protein n=1 Tax=Orbilia brochopaga TaxID=3140254 RepID=A0A481ZL91_9PEZI|nr:hypothetical protein [Drechslerella brochopaga]QBL02510.1 hypothetical protein [Drechslerella brochopaga]
MNVTREQICSHKMFYFLFPFFIKMVQTMSSIPIKKIAGLSWYDYCNKNTHILVVEPPYILHVRIIFYIKYNFYLIYVWRQIVLLYFSLLFKYNGDSGVPCINPVFYYI